MGRPTMRDVLSLTVTAFGAGGVGGALIAAGNEAMVSVTVAVLVFAVARIIIWIMTVGARRP